MRLYLVGVLILIAVTETPPQEKPEKRSQLTTQDILRSEVIGDLGVPLGTCVRVKATIEAPRGVKANSLRYFLNITHVDGHELKKSVVRKFYLHFQHTENVKLAIEPFGLYELLTGEKTGSLDSEEIAKLEKGYVGEEVELLIYESGRFDGIPKRLPEEIGIWQGTAFSFKTDVFVLDQY